MQLFPAIDLRDGKVVRLTQGDYDRMIVYGEDPCAQARKFLEAGAKNLHVVDLDGAKDGTLSNYEAIAALAKQGGLYIEVGGGIRTADDIRRMLLAGADKTSVNTAAILRPDLIREGAERFGSQCVVLAIDARRVPGENRWEVFTHGGRRNTGLDAVEWAVRGVELGAGEILLTSMDTDGTCAGYDCELTRAVSTAVNVPVIASGGAGTLEHLAEVLDRGKADAVLAASIFHFGTYTVPQAKEFLQSRNIPVRPADR